MMELQVWGGAGEHGRSCYVLTGEQHRIMLDCGVKKEGTGQYPLLNPGLIPGLTAVFLSHAHEDHSMALPMLYKLGYRGEIWTTRPTLHQLEHYFSNWKRYVNSRRAELPYDSSHIDAMKFRILEEETEEGAWLPLQEDLSLKWGRSGHMLGSVWFQIQMEGQQLFFSGDFTRESALLVADSPKDTMIQSSSRMSSSECRPTPAVPSLAIIDNAYGLDEESQEDKLSALREFIVKIQARGGHVLLPVPAFGRGQELLTWMMREFPGQQIVVEQTIRTGLHQMTEWPEWLRPEAMAQLRQALNSTDIYVPEDEEERLTLLQRTEPLIIFTTDGMMESTLARWYTEQLSSGIHAIVITGHASQGTFARRLLSGEIAGVDCQVVQISYKIHQGIGDVRRMMKELHSRHTVLVHAPKPETDRVVDRLTQEGIQGLHAMGPGSVLPL